MGLKRRNPARNRLLSPILPLSGLALVAGPTAGRDVAVPVSAAPPLDTPRPKPVLVSHEERHRMIARAAYGHAERTGFTSDPLANWLLAEREVDALMARKAS